MSSKPHAGGRSPGGRSPGQRSSAGDGRAAEGGRLLVGLGVAALATAGSVGLSRGAYELLMAQARIARRVIPKPTTWPFNGDGIYLPGADAPLENRLGAHADLEMMIFGDSLATGLGASSRAELPGVLLARGLAEESGKSVRLSTKAIVGASSKSLYSQVEASQITGGVPDIALILIGGNDVTAKNGISSSARRLGEVVRMLVDSGAHVVVGTCPDLGVIRPVPQPLRTVMHSWSLRLADAQAAQVRAAGGVPVSLNETLTPEMMSRPEALFSADQFHPNSDGYALAAAILLPAVCSAAGVWPAEDGALGAPTPSRSDSAPLAVSEDDAEAAANAPTNDGHVVKQLLGRLLAFARTGDGRARTTTRSEDSPFSQTSAMAMDDASSAVNETPGQTVARRAAGRFFTLSRFRRDTSGASAEATAPVDVDEAADVDESRPASSETTDSRTDRTDDPEGDPAN